MKPKSWISLMGLCVLGAMNGLLFGVAIEMLRVWYRRVEIAGYRAQELASPSGVIADYELPTIEVGTVLLCAIIFAGASHLIHRYYRWGARSVLLLWQVVGLLGATGYAILSFMSAPYSISRGLRWWYISLAVVVPANFLYAVILESAARFYTPSNNV